MEVKILREQDQVVVKVSGRVDTVTAGNLNVQLSPLFEEDIKKMCLDCTDLEYVSSSGIRFFVTAHKTMEAKGGVFLLAHLNKQVRSVLELTGLSKVMNIL